MYGSLYSLDLELCFALGIGGGLGREGGRETCAMMEHLSFTLAPASLSLSLSLPLSPRFNAVAFVWQLRFGKAAVISSKREKETDSF